MNAVRESEDTSYFAPAEVARPEDAPVRRVQWWRAGLGFALVPALVSAPLVFVSHSSHGFAYDWVHVGLPVGYLLTLLVFLPAFLLLALTGRLTPWRWLAVVLAIGLALAAILLALGGTSAGGAGVLAAVLLMGWLLAWAAGLRRRRA